MDLSSEEIGGKIQQILSSPESMAKLQSMLGAMSGVEATAPAPPPSPPPSAGGLEGLLGGSGGLDLGVLTKIAPLLGNLGKENEHTRLLHALKPYLHGGREKRLDDAIRMMQFAAIAPLLGGIGGKGG
ncbi:MAG: hypothetical protein IJW89_06645 [Clostridia bacterium]|nr:hypothetical protein [Clostridia bacterium]